MIAVSVDSGCAPTRSFVEEHKLFFMGMKIIIDDKEYNDEFDFMENVFYNIVESSREFHTAQPPLGQVLDYYNDIKSKGYTKLLDIHFSSKMSVCMILALWPPKWWRGWKSQLLIPEKSLLELI